MGKKRTWFGFLKRLFVCKAELTDEKGTKVRRWCFGILKINHQYNALETHETKVKDHEEDQKQHTMALANAMKAAADAAMAAASAAVELARLVALPENLERRARITAAIKIQSFYRSHLAWKALIGLRGVVKLQAVIRGQLVRQKLLNKIKNPNGSKVHQIWIPTLVQVSNIYKEKQDQRNDKRNKEILEDSTAKTTHHRFNLKTSIRSNQKNKPRLGHIHHTEQQPNSPSFGPRILHTSRRHNLSPDRSDDISLPNSPIYPAYMATTESFMAKARSLSTPRQRLSFLDGYCTHGSSFGIAMLSSSSSLNGGIKGNYRHMHM